jgi:hypothetical protein
MKFFTLSLSKGVLIKEFIFSLTISISKKVDISTKNT